MKSLLIKEFKIGIHPLFHLMALTGALILIPQWPFFISLMYCFFITIPNIFITSKAQNDVAFSVTLPVSKRNIVGARLLSIIVVELIYFIIAAIAALIRPTLYSFDNFLLDPGFAFFGLAFVISGIFNIVFFPMFYKSAYKILAPSLTAIGAAFVFAGLVEAVNLLVPGISAVIDETSRTGPQLLVLVCGIIIFVLMNVTAFKISATRFEKIDL